MSDAKEPTIKDDKRHELYGSLSDEHRAILYNLTKLLVKNEESK